MVVMTGFSGLGPGWLAGRIGAVGRETSALT